MSKEIGVLDQGRRGLHEGRRNCLKYLKSGWNRKEGKGNKDFKKGVASWIMGRVPYKRRAGTPLQTMTSEVHK